MRTIRVMTSASLDAFKLSLDLRARGLDSRNLAFRPLMGTLNVVHRNPADEVIVPDNRGNHFRADAVNARRLLLGSNVGRRIKAIVFDEGAAVFLQPPDRNGLALFQ